jgi:glycosyltransferase involved in cell wall biosynthesis
MRFLMLNWRDPKNPKAGGAERVTLAYWAALGQRGHEVYWYANEFPGCLPEEVIQGVRIVRGGGSGRSVLKVIRWYRRQKPFNLVVDQHHGIPWFVPWWAGTNCLSYVHEVLGPIWNSFYPWPLSRFGQWQERAVHWLYHRTPFWVGSESTQRALQRRGVRNVTVIHYGIEQRVLDVLEPKPLSTPLRLIAVSRLAPNKRIDHAILATGILATRGIDTHLTIVGGGEEEPRLRQLASQQRYAGRVSFAGMLPEAAKDAELRKSHFLIHTSIREGWGLNVLEANAVGTPAVVYPVDGLVDATIHDETGIVTREEKPESIADGLVALLQTPDRYQHYRVKACERTRSFHWSHILPPACDWLEQQAACPHPPTL